jgi:hypothetical protein
MEEGIHVKNVFISKKKTNVFAHFLPTGFVIHCPGPADHAPDGPAEDPGGSAEEAPG